MVVVADVRRCQGVLGFGLELRVVRDVSLADDPDTGMNWRRPGDGLGLPDPLQGLQGVDLGPLKDGGQVLLLGLQDELGFGAGLGADGGEGSLLSLHLGPGKMRTKN